MLFLSLFLLKWYPTSNPQLYYIVWGNKIFRTYSRSDTMLFFSDSIKTVGVLSYPTLFGFNIYFRFLIIILHKIHRFYSRYCLTLVFRSDLIIFNLLILTLVIFLWLRSFTYSCKCLTKTVIIKLSISNFIFTFFEYCNGRLNFYLRERRL